MEWIVIFALAVFLVGVAIVVREATSSHHPSKK